MSNHMFTARALMILLSAADYFGHLTKTDGSSMSPTLNPNPRSLWNDYLILRPIKAADVECGDVVTFSYPYDPSRRLIKRVIAKEGETVRYHSGMMTIPAGHIWVQGDNRANSRDSRDFGPVSLNLVSGIATNIVFPFSRMGAVNNDKQWRSGVVVDRDEILSAFGLPVGFGGMSTVDPAAPHFTPELQPFDSMRVPAAGGLAGGLDQSSPSPR